MEEDIYNRNANDNKITRASRDFKGIWIPADIYEREDICPREKFLLLEIDSLDKPDNKYGGCYASNDYLSKKIKLSAARVCVMIAHLKELKLIEQVSFDGKIRVLKSRMNKEKSL